jgi:hypothetical protein
MSGSACHPCYKSPQPGSLCLGGRSRAMAAAQVAACRFPGILSYEHPRASRRTPAHPHLPHARPLRRDNDLCLPGMHTRPRGARRRRYSPPEGQPAPATASTPGTRGRLTLPLRSMHDGILLAVTGPRLGTAPAAETRNAHARPDRCEANLQGDSRNLRVDDAPSPLEHRSTRQNPGRGSYGAMTATDLARCSTPPGAA